MILIGKIEYINLVPFDIFLKRYIKNTQTKQSINYHKSYPAKINKLFKKRDIDAGFISSVESFRGDFKRFDVGIVANKEVRSVLVKKGEVKNDFESASSNILARVLGINGEVVIGDKALKEYIQNPNTYQDLCSLWYQKERVPFVFARFCVNRHIKFYKKLITIFVNTNIKIPQYILKKYSKDKNIPIKDIREYLKLISYKIDPKAKKGLKKFKNLIYYNKK